MSYFTAAYNTGEAGHRQTETIVTAVTLDFRGS